MKKASHVISLIINILLATLIILLFCNAFTGFLGETNIVKDYLFFAKYEVLTLILLGFSSILTLIFDIISLSSVKSFPKIVSLFKMLSVSMLVVIAISTPIFNVYYSSLFAGNYNTPDYSIYGLTWGLWVNLLIPIIAIISFIFFENEERLSLVTSLYALIPGALYLAVILPLSINGVIEPLYPFFAFDTQSNYLILVAICLSMILGTFLISLIVIPFRNAISKIYAKKVPSTEDRTIEKNLKATIEIPIVDMKKIEEFDRNTKINDSLDKKSELANEPEEPILNEEEVSSDSQKDEIKKKAPKNKNVSIKIEHVSAYSEECEEAEERALIESDKRSGYLGRPRVYHISKQKNANKWQVKLATGQRAIRTFLTQQEAIDYAKNLVRKNGGSIRVHSVKGKLRKE